MSQAKVLQRLAETRHGPNKTPNASSRTASQASDASTIRPNQPKQRTRTSDDESSLVSCQDEPPKDAEFPSLKAKSGGADAAQIAAFSKSEKGEATVKDAAASLERRQSDAAAKSLPPQVIPDHEDEALNSLEYVIPDDESAYGCTLS